MHVGKSNKQIATKNMWEVTSNAPQSVRPRSIRNICPFFHNFPYVSFFVCIFLLFFFHRCFLLFWCVFLLSLCFLSCVPFAKLVFLRFSFFSFFLVLIFFTSVFQCFEKSLCECWSVISTWIYLFAKKKFVFKKNMTHFIKLSLFFNQFSHVSSAVLFLFLSFLKQRKIHPKKKTEKKCSFDQPFLLFFPSFFEKQEMFFSAFILS